VKLLDGDQVAAILQRAVISEGDGRLDQAEPYMLGYVAGLSQALALVQQLPRVEQLEVEV